MVREPVRRQRGEEGAQAADELGIAVVVRAGAWCLERDEPEDVGVQRRDGTDNGLVGEAGRPEHVVDGFTEAQPVRPEAGLLQRQWYDGRMGEQVLAKDPTECSKLLRPVVLLA